MTGGTEVALRGVGFVAGVSVTIGGRAGTDVRVQSSDLLLVKTPAGAAAAAVDVVVTVNGRSATLTGGFRYEPVGPNTAPVIRSITAQGRRLREPASFADLNETIQLTAVVEDAETAPALLTFQWQACGGAIIGSGPQVEWQAPSSYSVPALCAIELTVVDGTQRTTGSVAVRLHNSPSELRFLALDFLTEFATPSISPATAVRHFSDSCSGKASELADITRNRRDFTIRSHSYGEPTVTVGFGGMCPYRGELKAGDGCIITPVRWESTVNETGKLEVTSGTSYITAVYRESRWWLCDSGFSGTITAGLRFLE